jgi:hypothetical protein
VVVERVEDVSLDISPRKKLESKNNQTKRLKRSYANESTRGQIDKKILSTFIEDYL